MLTVDLDRLGISEGDTVLDLGSGPGRHSFEVQRKGAIPIAVDLDRAALGLGGAWTLVAGIASLRIAHYFRRWERARRKVILCLPRRAGLMRHVYVVADL